MATILNTLYPPLIDTFMPAFPYNTSATVNFTISPYNSYENIKYLHVTLVNQKTNQNVFKASIEEEDNASLAANANIKIINGVWIIPFQNTLSYEINNGSTIKKEIFWKPNHSANFYTLKIPAFLLKNNTNFVINSYYKLQIRFDSSPVLSTGLSSNHLTDNRANFSEWSSVCLLKAIPTVNVSLHNFTDSTKIPQFLPGIIPFVGNLTFSSGESLLSTTNNEYLSYYNLNILDKNSNVYLTSGKQFPNNKKSSSFYYLFDLTNATIEENYYVEITCTTNNQYTFTKKFQFKIVESSDIEFNPQWSFNKISLPAYGKDEKFLVTSEDGFVEITIRALNIGTSGYLFIKRANSLDNFKQWELIDCSFISSGNVLERSIIDKTVGSLVTYKYSCQFLTQKGSWTDTKFSSEIVYPDFHDILLSRGDKQLAIRYNAQIASMTPVTNRVKIDTLGGRYPKFAENAKLNYRQFQLNGLIVSESDYNRKFLSDLDYPNEMAIYDERMNGKYLVRNDTIKEIFWDNDYSGTKGAGTYSADITAQDTTIQKHKRDSQKNTTHDLYPTNNWWWERTFREEVIKWLNDGNPKLYRSMTEGNLIVMLDGVTLTPNQQLGRRIWNFSCTVYEVGDGYSLKELSALGIYNVKNEWAEIKGDSDSENDDENPSSDGSSIKESHIGQLYEIEANSTTDGTSIVLIDNSNSFQDRIEKNLNALYGVGLYENYTLESNSIYLQNLKIQFYSKPEWYHFVNTTEENNVLKQDLEHINALTFLEESEDNITTSEYIKYMKDNECHLGYKIFLKVAPITNIFKNEDKIIFVNQKGYYQVPSNMVVKNIALYDGAKASLDYTLNYSLRYTNKNEPNIYENVENIVGQIADEWQTGTNIMSVIRNKYNSYQRTVSSETTQSVDNLRGIDFDITPYTIIRLANEKNENLTEYVIGQSGVLNLQPDFSVQSCIIAGRRLIKVDRIKEEYLNEWECVFDKFVNDNSNYWYILDKDLLYRVTDTNDIKQAILNFQRLGRDNFILQYKDNIKIPEMNKIYEILDENEISGLCIYYLNKGWFSVSVDSNNSNIIKANVPVNGMINYKARIMKRVFFTGSA